MGRRPRRRGALVGALAGLLTVLTVLPGCDRADPGYVGVRTGMLTVSRPSDWQTGFGVQAPWTQGFRLGPTSVEQIQVSGDFGDFVTAAQGAGNLVGIGQVSLRGFSVVQTRDLEVAEATSAQAVRYTITDNQGSQVSGEWVVAVRWPERRSVAVSLLTPRFDPELERRVVDSIRFDPAR